jgi:prepilin-type N-terminal cleavage/methylation domain-containing protein
MRRQQSGFTLVEIAIVLVIIGLLLGGVLKGQELINSAKVKNLANDFRNISTFVYAYQDKFRALPGDDGGVAGHVNGGVVATTPAGTVANGRINGNWDSATATDESVLFWQHVRLAGLATGTPIIGNLTLADPYVPKNADNGRIGVTGDAVYTVAATPWTSNFFVCSSNIQGRFARQLDTTIDDGDTTTGTLRVICQGECANSAAYVNVTPALDANVYTVCMAN